MSTHPLGQPVVALLAWTVVMFLWMYATRIPALMRSGVDLKTMKGSTGRSLDELLPPAVQWKAHNYNHLLEQPVLFYAVCLLLILVGAEGEIAVGLAWVYVGLRVVHSLVQATVNIVRVRFLIFIAASLVLIGLIAVAAAALF